jgi:type II secretory pathway component PulF
LSSLAFPELLFVLFMLFVYGLVLFIIWKFYNVLSRMNDNLTGIRQALERSADRPQSAT